MKMDNSLRDDLLRKEIGARIVNLRVQRRLTQAELAKQSGISRFCLSRLENGVGGISFDSVLSVWRQLGVINSLSLLLPEVSVPLADMVDRGRRQGAQSPHTRVRKTAVRGKRVTGGKFWGDGRPVGGENA